jgi:uncharacterized membrane protein
MHARLPRIRRLWLPLSVALLAAAVASCNGDQTRDPAADLEAGAGDTAAENIDFGNAAAEAADDNAAADPESRRGPVLGAHVYDCQGLQISTEAQKKGGIYLFLPDRTLDLAHVPSGSGARYGDGEVEFWTKGPEATLDRGDGTAVHCTENRRASIIADARFRGMDFWGVGNEPGWRLEVGSDMILLVTNYGEDEYDFPTPEPSVDVRNRTTVYDVSAAGHSLRLEIRDTECFDDMSGERFESVVLLELDGRSYRGCGVGLH